MAFFLVSAGVTAAWYLRPVPPAQPVGKPVIKLMSSPTKMTASSESMLVEANNCMASGMHAQAEALFKKILADEQVEQHDPLRRDALLSYAALLKLHGKIEEARQLEQQADAIPIRTPKDLHPVRDHIS
jgi:hypothetical protein